MRHILLGLGFVFANCAGHAQQVEQPKKDLLLEPVGEVRFCGEIPTAIGEKITIVISDLSYCFNGKDKGGKVFSCKVPIKKPTLWFSIEDAFAEGQRRGSIGDIVVPADKCLELNS